MVPVALTIAGSDSSGGAGIQADLKTFTVHGVYGASVLTAVTAQNTLGVAGVVALSPEFVGLQIDTVLADLDVAAAKTGMLANAEIVLRVADRIRHHALRRLVVDPVMIAQSGASLLSADAVAAVREVLLPLAALVTPNLPEASVLVGKAVESLEDMRRAAEAICRLGAGACLVKGGHLGAGAAVDILFSEGEATEFARPRVATRHTHGTGCQLSAAITANLAAGHSLRDAVEGGKQFIHAAIEGGLAIGHGDGPANPMAWRRTALD